MKRLLPLLPAALLAWLWLAGRTPVSVGAVRVFLDARVTAVEETLQRRLDDLTARAGRLFALDRLRRLDETQLLPHEALLTVENGVVRRYIGEISFFRPLRLQTGETRLIRKGHEVFALRQLAPGRFHLGLFMDLEDERLLRPLRIGDAIVDLRFSALAIDRPAPGFEADSDGNRFFVRRLLAGSCGQLLLNLTVSRTDIDARIRRRNDVRISWSLLLLSLCLLAAVPAASRLRAPVACAAGLLALLAAWRAVSWLAAPNMDWPLGGVSLQRIQHLLLVLLFAGAGLLFFGKRRRRGSRAAAFAVFNLAAAAGTWLAAASLRHIDFPFADFGLSPAYLSLLGVMLLLHLLPVLAGSLGMPPPEPVVGPSAWVRRHGPWLLLQAIVLAAALWLKWSGWTGWLLLAVSFWILQGAPGRLWPRFLVGLAAAVSVTAMMLAGDAVEKKSFIRESLRPIFTSQSHYAKLVAREVVAVINARGRSPADFFGPLEGGLEEIWRSSLASRENIASGIFVLGPDGRLLREFYYQMPYIPVPPRRGELFPFWHVEEVAADLFGRTVQLAVATINVFDAGRHLGAVVIEVLNSPELILKNRDQTTIFTIDRRIRGDRLSYIRLDEDGRVLENPANLNMADFAPLQKSDGRWVEFSDGGTRYAGYAFRQQEQTAIIFYPEQSPMRVFALFVRIFLVAVLLLAAGRLRDLRRIEWALLYRSFSVKVLLILVLISLSTALLFSLFALNANFAAQARLARTAAYDRGRVAQNIIRSLIAETGEITPNHLFLLAGILDGDVSVYENGALLYASNYRQVIRLQLPAHLNSRIRRTLEQSNQPFALQDRGDGGVNLYFRVMPAYIVRADVSSDRANAVQSRQDHVDFTISLLFIMLLVGVAAARFFRNLILAPIHELNRGMAAVERGQLEALPDIPTEVELKSLYAGFNAMVEGVREQRRSIGEIARMKTMIQLGRRVAHEVKNPLTPIRLSAEQIPLLLRDRDANPQWQQQVVQAAHFITEETEHLRKVAYGFLDLSRLDEMHRETFRLGELVEQELDSLRPLYTQVRFDVLSDSLDVEVSADRTKIKQALRNIVANAIDAVVPGRGTIRVGYRGDGAWALLTVADNGHGMDPEELQRIEKENYTQKESGSGLGLTIVRHIMDLHHGQVTIASDPEHGTTVTLRFARRHDPQG